MAPALPVPCRRPLGFWCIPRRIDPFIESRVIKIPQSPRYRVFQYRPNPLQRTSLQPMASCFVQKQLHILEKLAGGEIRLVVIALQQAGQLLVERRSKKSAVAQDAHEGINGNASPLHESYAQREG